jgi:hypothetical protein
MLMVGTKGHPNVRTAEIGHLIVKEVTSTSRLSLRFCLPVCFRVGRGVNQAMVAELSEDDESGDVEVVS